jgi:hypothetical protein
VVRPRVTGVAPSTRNITPTLKRFRLNVASRGFCRRPFDGLLKLGDAFAAAVQFLTTETIAHIREHAEQIDRHDR